MKIIENLLIGDHMIKIATSILNANNKVDSILKLNKTNTDYIHIDVMDNIFVPNYSFPVNEVNELSKYTQKPFDIHLMVSDPETFIKNLDSNNIKCITIHIEIDKDIHKLIKLIKSYNYEVGLAIKPNTDISLLDKYINDIDKIIIMSVEPGYGGQLFIEKSIDRCKTIKEKYRNTILEIDGGINNETIKKIENYCDIAVVGTYITKNDNYQEAINNLKN